MSLLSKIKIEFAKVCNCRREIKQRKCVTVVEFKVEARKACNCCPKIEVGVAKVCSCRRKSRWNLPKCVQPPSTVKSESFLSVKRSSTIRAKVEVAIVYHCHRKSYFSLDARSAYMHQNCEHQTCFPRDPSPRV